ncbi:YgaP family membrane protein [Bacillus solitudinis]|uniref:YgaP family membrane protein n=1 Tax=Bacillus solitudinis TaxID=2014074 RepID=UPI000C24F5C3|nr:DUF2892 domain-containing protein [Bacillus solitudinis]
MQPNIGRLNALLRISCGFCLLAWATARMVRKPLQSLPMIATIMGGMKVAEGITRFCPMVFVFQSLTVGSNNEETQTESSQENSSINPS